MYEMGQKPIAGLTQPIAEVAASIQSVGPVIESDVGLVVAGLLGRGGVQEGNLCRRSTEVQGSR